MKTNLIFLFTMFIALLVTNCSKDEDFIVEELDGEWLLINISGGFATSDCAIPNGEIRYTFADNEVLIENNYILNPSQNCGNLVGSKTVSFSVSESNDITYLEVDEIGVGRIIFEGDQMIFDQNQQPDGAGADFKVYTFER